MKKQNDLLIGELEIPTDYFEFTEEEKDELCNQVMDMMLTVLDRQLKPELNRINVLDKILESSIITNQEMEQYEICQVLMDIRNRLNE